MRYYLLKGDIDKITEKAIGVVTGSNNSIVKLKLFLQWIPKSIIKEVDNNLYIPQWFIFSEPDIPKVINFNDFIEVEEEKKTKKKRKTKEEKELEYYNNQLRLYFNDDIPNEYIEYYYDADDLRFTKMNKLQTILNKQDVEKVIIVKNGIKEIVKGA